MTDTAARHIHAKSRWHAVWVLFWDCIRHPNSARVIHIGRRP